MDPMDFEFTDAFYTVDNWARPTPNQELLIPHSYNPSSPLQTISETGQAHFLASSYNNPVHDVQSPQSYVMSPVSPMDMGSSGYQSASPLSLTNFDLPAFNIHQRPAGSLPATSLLTRKLKAQSQVSNLPSSPIVNQPMSPMHNFDPSSGFPLASSMPHYPSANFGLPLNHDQILSKQLETNELGTKTVDAQELWFSSSSSVGAAHPVQIPNRHHRTPSFVSSVGTGNSYRQQPYRRPPSLAFSSATPELVMSAPSQASVSIPTSPPTFSDLGTGTAGFTPEQIPAAQAIVQFINEHPAAKIPAALITRELVEVSDGRGYCLIGACALKRAEQKVDPSYNADLDTTTRKRLDHLYDHVKEKHFNSRPFVCQICSSMGNVSSFAREHDLKRHEQTHQGTTHSCPDLQCGKTYTRRDNLQRHVSQKHPKLLVSQSLPARQASLGC